MEQRALPTTRSPQVKLEERALAASEEWERFALQLVSSSQLITAEDLERLSGEQDFLLSLAEATREAGFIADPSASFRGCATCNCTHLMRHSVCHLTDYLMRQSLSNDD